MLDKIHKHKNKTAKRIDIKKPRSGKLPQGHTKNNQHHFTKTYLYNFDPLNLAFTVDSRYLELQGTLWNTSRYP